MRYKHYDFLIVGSGLYGATFAYFARKAGKKVLVIEKRNHIGGNIYCENIGGINVHKYGAHIFHTSNKEVWDFVNSIVEFNRYTNSPLANFRGKLYNLPFNMNTFYQIWGTKSPDEAIKRLNEQRQEAICRMKNEGVKEPRNLAEQAEILVGKDIYEALIKGYTEKQWGRKCEDLPAFIIRRLPVRLTYDNNYFNDKFQGVPIGGYNKLIQGLLWDVECLLDTDYFKESHKEGCSKNTILDTKFDKVIFTGKLDEFFSYCYGKLEYRTVKFETEVLNIPNYQGNAVINFTDNSEPYTRIIEHKHFEMFGDDVYKVPNTVISKEYSVEWKNGMEPYYPINDPRNSSLLEKYKILADEENGVIFGGRLAEYRYYDMDDIVEKAMSDSKCLFSKL